MYMYTSIYMYTIPLQVQTAMHDTNKQPGFYRTKRILNRRRVGLGVRGTVMASVAPPEEVLAQAPYPVWPASDQQ